MATLFPVAGAKIYIGEEPMATGLEDWSGPDFVGISWVEIDGWMQMGAVGDAAETIRTNLINRRRTVKQKGTRDAGSMENVFARLVDDPGQILVIAADQTQLEYPFRIVFDDKPIVVSPQTSFATTVYWTGLVNGARRAGGDANTVVALNTTFEINSNVFEIPARIEAS